MGLSDGLVEKRWKKSLDMGGGFRVGLGSAGEMALILRREKERDHGKGIRNKRASALAAI